MIKKIINDKTVEKSELASAQGNPNKIFKILFGADRRELFKKYAQEQHRFPIDEDEFGKTDFNDINTWIKPIPGLGKNTYYNESQFDAIIEKLKKEDDLAKESKSIALSQNELAQKEAEEKAKQAENIEKHTEATVPLKEGPGIEYLGVGGRYRMYRVTSPEGAQKFAVPTSIKGVRGWCITGGLGPNYQWGGSNHFNGQADRTIDGAFYIFETNNIADNWAIYILRNHPKVNDGNGAGLAFTPNDTDDNLYYIPEDCDAPYDKVPQLAKYIDVTPRGKGGHVNHEDNDGFYRFNGSTLTGIMDTEVTQLDIPATYTRVANSAFSDLHQLQRISFTNTLTSLGANAFTGCLKLKEINIKSNNLEIGNGTFSYTDIDKINIFGVQRIPDKAFHNCKNLKALDISDSLMSIGTEAFLGCEQITYLRIPTTCTTIGNNAFFKCKNLVIATDFEEMPSGWYKNIERHVKEIIFKNKPEETTEQTQDSIPTEEYIINRKEDDAFYSEHTGSPEWTYWLDNAKKFKTREEAEEVINLINEKDKCNVLSVKEYQDSIADSVPVKDSGLISELRKTAKGDKNSDGEFEFKTDEDIDRVINAIDKLGYTYTGYEPRKKGQWEYKVFFIDSKLNDIEPKEGEKKADFISRFMSETKNEYPDEKQRLAVAYSYWNKKKTKINDSEVYSIWDMFNNSECAGWIFKMDDDPTLCISMPSNQLGFLEEDEESMSDRLVVEEKLPIKDNLYIFIGHGEDEGIFTKKSFEITGEPLMTIDEAINDIKKSWKISFNDSEMVIDTEAKDEEITPEEQEVKEIVANFSIQELAKEAKEELKNSTDLDTTYNKWLKKSEDLYEEGKITINQQEEFEDELWECYKEIM